MRAHGVYHGVCQALLPQLPPTSIRTSRRICEYIKNNNLKEKGLPIPHMYGGVYFSIFLPQNLLSFPTHTTALKSVIFINKLFFLLYFDIREASTTENLQPPVTSKVTTVIVITWIQRLRLLPGLIKAQRSCVGLAVGGGSIYKVRYRNNN